VNRNRPFSDRASIVEWLRAQGNRDDISDRGSSWMLHAADQIMKGADLGLGDSDAERIAYEVGRRDERHAWEGRMLEALERIATALENDRG